MSLWRARSNPLTWWWAMLTLVSLVNIAVWFLLYRELHSQPVGSMELMLLLCGTYVFGCAFRSVLPRADVQRICLFDTWLSSVLVGRSVATVAEVCFVAQWAIILHQLGTVTGSDTVLNVALDHRAADPDRRMFFVVRRAHHQLPLQRDREFAVGRRLLPGRHRHCAGCCRNSRARSRVVLVLSIAGIVAYLAFLLTIDVPMYFSRWRTGLVDGNKLLGLFEGLRDVSTRWVKTHDIAHWKGEIAWMSLYFSGAVWASLALCVFYSLEGELPQYRTEAAAIAAPARHAETTTGNAGVASVARRSEAAVRATASPF